MTDDSFYRQRVASPQVRSGFTGVAVTATSRDMIETFAVGVGGSSVTTVQLSAGVNVVDNTTRAFVADSAKVNQTTVADSDQDVLVAAGSDFAHLAIAGGVAIAIEGLAAAPSFELSAVTLTTEAFVGSSALVSAERDIEIASSSTQDFATVAAGIGGSGTVGVAGSVGIQALTTHTHAFIDDSATPLSFVLEYKNRDDTVATIIAWDESASSEIVSRSDSPPKKASDSDEGETM